MMPFLQYRGSRHINSQGRLTKKFALDVGFKGKYEGAVGLSQRVKKFKVRD